MRTHRHATGGDRGPAARALRGMGGEAFEYGGAEARPHQAFRDVRVGGVEGVQIGVRLSLLEAALDLPAESIEA